MSAVDLAARDQADRAPGAGPTSAEQRLIDAALRCIARWGVTKTTLDDIAKEAGCSRATAYRAFPGGRDALLARVAGSEVDRGFAAVAAATEAAGPDLEDRLVAGLSTAAAVVAGHPALRFLLDHEPEVVLPRLAFAEMDFVLAGAAARLAPLFQGHLGSEDAARTVEWLARLVVSTVCSPSPAFDLVDPAVARRLVSAFVLPGLPSAVPA